MCETPTIGVILVAAGAGTRLGQSAPKAFVPIGGRSIIERALRTLFELSEPAHIVVVVPEAYRDEALVLSRQVAGIAARYVQVVTGGATRADSVAAGLAALPESAEIVLVHDAARAYTPISLFEGVIDEVRAGGAGVIPALPVTDSIKTVTQTGAVTGAIDRTTLAAVQTPQGFPRSALSDAYRAAGADRSGFTDDASVYAAAGHPVVTVAGDALAFKITTPWDLRRAETLGHTEARLATGIGVDVHAYDPDSALWLGGVLWPGEMGLAGHSDGDALTHALCDALLSAAGLGDIGGWFGTSDPRAAGAHADYFVPQTVQAVTEAGYEVVNVAVQVVAVHPKLSTRREEIQRVLSALVGAPVTVAGTTSDGLGFTGRAEGVTAIATALLRGAP